MFRSRVVDEIGKGYLEEILVGDGDDIFICAPHGGMVEPRTEIQAKELYKRVDNSTCWWTIGTGKNAFEKWHISSDEILPKQFELLKRLDSEFNIGVSFHGMSDEYKGIVIGGEADEQLKCELQRSLRETLNCGYDVPDSIKSVGKIDSNSLVEVADAVDSSYTPILISSNKLDKFSGFGDDNIVNKFVKDNQGIQIEQSSYIRQNNWYDVVSCVEKVIRNQG